MEQISLHHLTFTYQNSSPVLTDVDLTIPLQTTILFSGPVGCGKTTLLKIIAGLLPKYGGSLKGQINLPENKRVGMLFQDPAMQFTMNTPQHELEFTLENLQVPQGQIEQRVNDALAFVSLNNLAHRKLSTLSGGQLQRVALAITIAMKADIILLDEPFASIDEDNRRFLLEKLIELQRQNGTTIIISDHDLHNYQDVIHQVVIFRDHNAVLLSPEESQQRLMDANRHHVSNLITSLPDSTQPIALTLNDYAVTRNKNTILDISHLNVIQNKVTLLTGPSGVGKSTLLDSIAKLISYTGEINYLGHNIQKISPGKYYSKVALMFQETNQQFLDVTVGEELQLSLKNGRNSFFKEMTPQQVLNLVDLPDITNRVVYSLSGGQRKLIQNLVMLIMGQEVLLMDEPFTGLDHYSLQKLLKVFKQSQECFPQTFLIVSHQLDDLKGFIDYHLVLAHQQLSYLGGSHDESQH